MVTIASTAGGVFHVNNYESRAITLLTPLFRMQVLMSWTLMII